MEDIIKLQGIFENGYGFIAKKVMKDKNLNVISKAIYSYICSYSGKGQDAFPSQKLICFDLGISKDTLSKYMKELKNKNYITVKQSKEEGKFARNIYTVNIVPCMVSSDTVSTDTETTGYDEVDTNNNSSNNNNKSINNKDKITYKNNSQSPLVQQMLNKYNSLNFRKYEIVPSNKIFTDANNILGTKKLFEALEIMSKSSWVKENMSIESIFKVDNLKKALNGAFKADKKEVAPAKLKVASKIDEWEEWKNDRI